MFDKEIVVFYLSSGFVLFAGVLVVIDRVAKTNRGEFAIL